MKRKAAAAIALSAALVALHPMPVHAQLFGASGLDPRFCEQESLRQTVVYIDDMMMIDGHTEWASKLAEKLRSTLAPGEHVTVVRLSTTNGTSREVWSGCWPDYSESERAKIASQTYLFSRSPLAQLDDQKKFFLQGLGSALTTIYTSDKRPVAVARFAATAPPTKQILRALASDEGRFGNSKITTRAILYSDLVENSDLGSVFKRLPAPIPDYGKILGSYLRRSVFYAYGVGDDITDAPTFQEEARGFWSAALPRMAATVASIGTDLNVPNTTPLKSYNYPITLDFDHQQFDGRISLLTNGEGDLVDSWIGVSRLGTALLSGTFRCTNNDASCRLDATTSTGITTTSPSEMVTLAGSEKAGMKGHLGVRGSDANGLNTMFDISATSTDR